MRPGRTEDGNDRWQARDETRLFVAHDEGRWDAAQLASYVATLDPEERARYAGYLRDDDRRRFAIGRALVRAALSSCSPRDPRAWAFVRERHGRPRLAPDQRTPDLRFSLSHARGLLACLVSVGGDVGVDVEDCDAAAPPAWQRKLLSPTEALALAQLPPSERRRRAWELWTLKEAYLKALGVGLSVPLTSITFAIEPGRSPVLRAAPAGLDADTEGWRFISHRATEHHHVAAALRPSGALNPSERTD